MAWPCASCWNSTTSTPTACCGRGCSCAWSEWAGPPIKQTKKRGRQEAPPFFWPQSPLPSKLGFVDADLELAADAADVVLGRGGAVDLGELLAQQGALLLRQFLRLARMHGIDREHRLAAIRQGEAAERGLALFRRGHGEDGAVGLARRHRRATRQARQRHDAVLGSGQRGQRLAL